jgi:hypothetical protein
LHAVNRPSIASATVLCRLDRSVKGIDGRVVQVSFFRVDLHWTVFSAVLAEVEQGKPEEEGEPAHGDADGGDAASA